MNDYLPTERPKTQGSSSNGLKRAKNIRDSIEDRIGFNQYLVKSGIEDSDLWTYDIALIGLLDCTLINFKI